MLRVRKHSSAPSSIATGSGSSPVAPATMAPAKIKPTSQACLRLKRSISSMPSTLIWRLPCSAASVSWLLCTSSTSPMLRRVSAIFSCTIPEWWLIASTWTWYFSRSCKSLIVRRRNMEPGSSTASARRRSPASRSESENLTSAWMAMPGRFLTFRMDS